MLKIYGQIILILALGMYGVTGNEEKCYFDALNCDDTTLEEERLHSASCEILLDALYDLEMTGSLSRSENNPEVTKTNTLQRQRHREPSDTNHRQPSERNVRRKRAESTTTASTSGQPSLPAFFPNPNMTEFENQVRLKVCKSLLQLPGVRQRCCTTMWVVCPEFGPDSESGAISEPAPSNSHGGGGSTVENSSNQAGGGNSGQSILSGIADGLMNTLTNFLNAQVQQPVQQIFGNPRPQG